MGDGKEAEGAEWAARTLRTTVNELCLSTQLQLPLAKLPANTPAAMCVKAGMGAVWVLDRHVVVVFLRTSGGTMRIMKVNSHYNSRWSAFCGSGTALGT